MVVNQARYHCVEQLVDALARVGAHNASHRIDQHEGRPGSNPAGLPYLEVVIVNDGVFDLVTVDGRSDGCCFFLGRELRGVDADADQFLAIFVLQGLKVRQDVQAR